MAYSVKHDDPDPPPEGPIPPAMLTDKRRAPEEPPSETMVGSLNMADRRDVALLRDSIRRRPKVWRGLDDSEKLKYVVALGKARDKAVDIMELADDLGLALKAVDSVRGTATAATMIEAQNLSAQQIAEKNERIDSGKATEGVRVIIE